MAEKKTDETTFRWINTNHKGLRYRAHPTRKHGIQTDKYYAIRFKVDGKRYEQGLGWLSDGWTLKKAVDKLNELRQCAKEGKPFMLQEIRAAAAERKKEEEEARAREEEDNVLVDAFWTDTYLPSARATKNPRTIETEKSYYTNWIKPVIGHIPIRDLVPFHVQGIRKKLLDAEKTPRTIQYCLAIVRQIWNTAVRDGLVSGPSPTRDVKVPKIDNARVRFLSVAEAETLLTALKTKSEKTYRISLLSFHTGMRFGEIANLRWGDIDIERGIITIMQSKNNRTRYAFMTDGVKDMFAEMKPGCAEDFVFLDRKGQKLFDISNMFQRTVDEIGLNAGVEDPKRKVVFHTLRHSFASLLVENGTDLYTVQKLLGHQTLSQTTRYAHLSNGALKNAIERLNEKITTDRAKADRENVVELKR